MTNLELEAEQRRHIMHVTVSSGYCCLHSTLRDHEVHFYAGACCEVCQYEVDE